MFSFQFLPVIVSHHRNKVNVPDAQHTHPEHTFIVLFDKPPRSVEEVDRRVLLAAELLALLIGIHIEVDRRAAHAGVLSHSVAVGVARRADDEHLGTEGNDLLIHCDGADVESGAYISLYDSTTETFTDAPSLPPQRSGYIELVCMVPTGWQKITVTYTPTFVTNKTLTFSLSASDVAKA